MTGERKHRADDEQADATAAIRQLLSEGRISKTLPMRGNDGVYTTVTIEQEGPVAYMETTTASSVFEEDLNRCLQLYADDSPEQTQRIVDRVARDWMDWSTEEVSNNQDIIDRHWEFQRLLSSRDVTKVVIPFAAKIAEHIPYDRRESRRVTKHIMNMIATITILHRFQRKFENGVLVATEDDYEGSAGVTGRAVTTPL